MNILEKTLEDIVFQTPNEILRERGLSIEGKKKRQVKIGNYGIADIISVRREPMPYGSKVFFTVFELKQNKIDLSAFLQALKYAKGIKHYLSLHRPLIKEYKLEIKLIGTSIDLNGAFPYFPDILSNNDYDGNGVLIELYTMSLNIDGVFFQEKYDYELINHGFNG